MGLHHLPLLRAGIFLAGSQPAARLEALGWGGESLFLLLLASCFPPRWMLRCGSSVLCVRGPSPSHAPVTNSLLMGT